MARTTRLVKSVSKLILPVIFLSLAAIASASIWLLHEVSQPSRLEYLVTPEKYGQLSAKGAQVTDESWQSSDGTTARGWLLRGTPNAPAVLLLHRYGADRSHVLNLGVKLNEATNFTVLMPDLRGHGPQPAVTQTSFGGCEASDASAAIVFLRSLKTPEGLTLVGKDIGIYGLELGALSGLSAADIDKSVKALVLDSVPASSAHLLESSIAKRYPFASSVTGKLADLGTPAYYYGGCYKPEPACEIAKRLGERRVMILGGVDAEMFQESGSRVAKCFPLNSIVETKTDLSPSGYSIFSASIEISSAYEQRVIDFLKQALTLQ